MCFGKIAPKFYKLIKQNTKSDILDKVEEGIITQAEILEDFDPISNRLHYKTDGVFRILMCVPFGFLVAWILKIPILSLFFDYLYGKVSDNRQCSRK